MTDLVGTVVDRVAFEVERGKVLELARATHAADPVHRGPEALATATHVIVAGHQRDQVGFVAKLGLDRARVVVGSVGWDYERALRVGDALTGTRTVVADETREGRGGTMRLVTLETEFVDQDGVIAVRQREVLIERGQA